LIPNHEFDDPKSSNEEEERKRRSEQNVPFSESREMKGRMLGLEDAVSTQEGSN
jgi:hypothetical protein